MTMTNQEAKYIKIPVWLATILAAAVLGFCVDTWRTVNKVDVELRCLRAELAAKGVIDPKSYSLCVPEAAKMLHFADISGNQSYQSFQNDKN